MKFTDNDVDLFKKTYERIKSINIAEKVGSFENKKIELDDNSKDVIKREVNKILDCRKNAYHFQNDINTYHIIKDFIAKCDFGVMIYEKLPFKEDIPLTTGFNYISVNFSADTPEFTANIKKLLAAELDCGLIIVTNPRCSGVLNKTLRHLKMKVDVRISCRPVEKYNTNYDIIVDFPIEDTSGSLGVKDSTYI